MLHDYDFWGTGNLQYITAIAYWLMKVTEVWKFQKPGEQNMAMQQIFNFS